jgi:hypothetical protein
VCVNGWFAVWFAGLCECSAPMGVCVKVCVVLGVVVCYGLWVVER